MPISKSQTIYKWKNRGLIYDNYDELYEVYIKTMECQHCNKAFKKSSDRCLDHDHETGLFRKIVCRGCNVLDSYIKYPNGYSRQEYNQANKEKFKEYYQEYYQANKEQKKEYYQANKEYRKEYKQEYWQAYKQEYYQKNKQRISERDKEKIECDCGSIVRRSDIARHNRTKKHSNYKLNNLV